MSTKIGTVIELKNICSRGHCLIVRDISMYSGWTLKFKFSIYSTQEVEFW